MVEGNYAAAASAAFKTTHASLWALKRVVIAQTAQKLSGAFHTETSQNVLLLCDSQLNQMML